MVNNIKIFSVSLVLFLIILSISLISALDTVSSGFEMTGGQTKMIVAHSVCKVVENQVARKVFVPTNTLGEWQSFMDNLPYGVVLHACPFCNDGSCNGAETCSSCPNDCGACQGDTCSLIGGCESGYCVHNICRPSSIYCGDIYCDSGETCSSCASDCGACCGNGACDYGETCSSCASDCGACCGNGACDYGETCSSCPTDCGVCYVSPTYTEGGDGVTPDPPASPAYDAGSYDYHEDFYSGGGDWGVDTSVNSDPDGGMPSGGYSDDTSGGGGSCFPAGTKIIMADGTQKNIEDVKIGEMVLSYDEETNKKTLSEVRELEKPVRNHMCKIIFEDKSFLKLTNEHPVLTINGWKSINPFELLKENPYFFADKLHIGDEVISEKSNKKVVDISCEKGIFQTYNLKEVANQNTFFAEGVVVHNKVICTETHRLGYISDEFYNADMEYAEKYAYNDVAVEIGYHSWAKPFVRVMRKNPEFVKKGVPIVIEWSKHTAYEMGVINEDSEIGKVLLETGIPMSKELGNMMIKDGNQDYEFDENLVEGLFYEYFPDILEMDCEQLEKGITAFYQELENEYLINKDSYEEENFQVWF